MVLRRRKRISRISRGLTSEDSACSWAELMSVGGTGPQWLDQAFTVLFYDTRTSFISHDLLVQFSGREVQAHPSRISYRPRLLHRGLNAGEGPPGKAVRPPGESSPSCPRQPGPSWDRGYAFCLFRCWF